MKSRVINSSIVDNFLHIYYCMTLFAHSSFNHRSFFFDQALISGHHFNCSTRLLAPYYEGFDAKTSTMYFKFNELLFTLLALRNFLVELARNIYRDLHQKFARRSLLHFIFVFSERDYAAIFTFIFSTISKKLRFFQDLYSKRKRFIDLGFFRFYMMVRPLEGFITNCSSINVDPGSENWKGLPAVLDYGKLVFFSFGDYTLLNVLKSARANINSMVIGVTDSNQFKVTDYYDFPLVGNDQSFKLFAFVSLFFLKIVFSQVGTMI